MHIKKTQSLSRLKGQYKTQSMMQYEMRIPIFRSYNKTYLYKRGFTGHLTITARCSTHYLAQNSLFMRLILANVIK